MLMVAGLHVPVIPLVDVVSNTGATDPAQNAGIAAKVGVIGSVISTVIVVGTPQVAPVGVKVYVVEPSADVLIVAGDQVPVIPLLEVSGSAGAVAFRQSGPMASKTGVTEAAMVISIVTGTLHSPAAGVKV